MTENTLQESKNWNKNAQFRGHFIEEGYPFQEGYPRYDYGKTFTLITRDGEVHNHVKVDHSTECRAEGLIWRGNYGQGEAIYKETVLCWIEEA